MRPPYARGPSGALPPGPLGGRVQPAIWIALSAEVTLTADAAADLRQVTDLVPDGPLACRGTDPIAEPDEQVPPTRTWSWLVSALTIPTALGRILRKLTEPLRN